MNEIVTGPSVAVEVATKRGYVTKAVWLAPSVTFNQTEVAPATLGVPARTPAEFRTRPGGRGVGLGGRYGSGECVSSGDQGLTVDEERGRLGFPARRHARRRGAEGGARRIEESRAREEPDGVFAAGERDLPVRAKGRGVL